MISAAEGARPEEQPKLGQPGVDVDIENLGPHRLRVNLHGDLGLNWFGRLTTALARQNVSVDRAYAQRQPDGTWQGMLELFTEHAHVDAMMLDYAALCGSPLGGMQSSMPVVERYRLDRTETGCIELRLVAEDRIGLLAKLLDQLEFLSLFPDRFRVLTYDGRVDDTLWLRGVAGSAPSAQAEQALRQLLADQKKT